MLSNSLSHRIIRGSILYYHPPMPNEHKSRDKSYTLPLPHLIIGRASRAAHSTVSQPHPAQAPISSYHHRPLLHPSPSLQPQPRLASPHVHAYVHQAQARTALPSHPP